MQLPGLLSPLPCPEEVRRMKISHRPLISQLLPGHSFCGPVSHNQNTDTLIPAQPRRICSYVADPARSLSVHSKTGSSGTATLCETLHCISQHWYFNALTSILWIPLFPTAEEDVHWWTSAHNVLRIAPVTPTESDTQFFTDALNIGWGARWNALTVSDVWTTTDKALHINRLNLEAIHRAIPH